MFTVEKVVLFQIQVKKINQKFMTKKFHNEKKIQNSSKMSCCDQISTNKVVIL